MSDGKEARPPTGGISRSEILRHYARPGLSTALVRALESAGKNPAALEPSDLWPADQFHIGGPRETGLLAELAEINAGMRVLDAGGGLGGSARLLASRIGCRVDVLDISADYCDAGRDLTRRTRLDRLVRYHCGDAQHPPFCDGTFDVVFMQHCSMNVEDKRALFRECHRVLRPGGRLALHEVARGDSAPLHYPVPWARNPETSFLLSPAEMRDALAAEGFAVLHWNDITDRSRAWLEKRVIAMRDALERPAFGLHLVLGPDFGRMLENQLSNIDEGTQRILQAVCESRDGDQRNR